MRATRVQEIWVGLFVALGIAALFMLATRVSNFSSYSNGDQDHITVYFDNIGGLKVRSPVTMSGVRVGRVSAIGYDPENLQARVELAIDSQYMKILTTDTVASIYTAGLLGEQYISLEPGAEDEMLSDGGVIMHSQSAVVLEELIGQFMVKMTSK
ncbi:MAG TPA: outer membrane lipid asymmetry maintenance protein MlaD [Gammaproteobacteria bacterium]|nr:outer membrane lipid asymmetry maintenance protein MlaD [Gammaproteobacteria bacterium]